MNEILPAAKRQSPRVKILKYCKHHPAIPAQVRGLCKRCYQRMHSSPHIPDPETQVQLDAADRLDRVLDCWPAGPADAA